MDENQPDAGSTSIKLVHLTHFLQQLPMILFGQILSATVVAYLITGRVSATIVTAWISVFALIVAARVGMYFYQVIHPNTFENRVRRVFWHTVGAGLLGLMWGGMAFMLIDRNNDTFSFIIVMVLLGLVASSVASTANLRSVFLVFGIFTLTPAVIKFYLLGGPHYTFLAFLILFFLFIISQFEKGIHRALSDSIRLRFNNVKLIENLTQEKLRAEESQRKVEKALINAEQANMAKSQFLAAASHDLRQPLHALRLLSTTLETTELDDQQSPLVDNISSSVHSLEELFNSLLDISKLDAGTQSVEKSTVYLSDVFENVQRNHAGIAVVHGLQLTVEETNILVKTDIILLERLLANLVSNAIRYTPSGTVTLSAEQKQDKCIIQVTDTGVGIDVTDQSRIFEEFVQLDNPERDRTKGIGLGLAIVKRTADLLDLPLTLKSTVNEGSTFSIEVPVGKTADLNVVAFPNEENQGDSARTALDGLLDSWGCVGLLASNGNEAERVIREIDTFPDAIIADLRLRDNETGVDVIQRVNDKFGSSCPVLIMTGDIAPNRLREIQDAEYPIFHKPCDPQALRSFLSDITRRSNPEEVSA